jgi:hypothetical protein
MTLEISVKRENGNSKAKTGKEGSLYTYYSPTDRFHQTTDTEQFRAERKIPWSASGHGRSASAAKVSHDGPRVMLSGISGEFISDTTRCHVLAQEEAPSC